MTPISKWFRSSTIDDPPLGPVAGPPPGVAPGSPAAWWLAALLLAALLVGLDAHTRVHGPQPAFEAVAHERLAAFAARLANAPPGAAPVVMLGTSMLRDATDAEERLEPRLSTASGRPVRLLRIVRLAGQMEDFEPLWPALAALRPALVVLEAELSNDLTVPAYAFQRLAEDRLQARLMLKGGPNYAHTFRQAQETPVWAQPVSPEVRDAILAQYRLSPPFRRPLDARTVARLRELRAAGSQVVVLDVPRAETFEAHVREAKDAWLASVSRIAGDPAIEGLRYPGRLEPQLFSDGFHMQPEARAEYGRWLVPALAERLRAPVR